MFEVCVGRAIVWLISWQCYISFPRRKLLSIGGSWSIISIECSSPSRLKVPLACKHQYYHWLFRRFRIVHQIILLSNFIIERVGCLLREQRFLRLCVNRFEVCVRRAIGWLTSCAGMTYVENFLSENCNIFSVLSIFKYNLKDKPNNKFITSW